MNSILDLNYHHRCRPNRIDVKCSNCGAKATAKKKFDGPSTETVHTFLSPDFYSHDWEISCIGCGKEKKELSYDELPSLYFSGKSNGFWAWNSEHLHCVLSFLAGDDVSTHSYQWYMAFVKPEWKSQMRKNIDQLFRQK